MDWFLLSLLLQYGLKNARTHKVTRVCKVCYGRGTVVDVQAYRSEPRVCPQCSGAGKLALIA